MQDVNGISYIVTNYALAKCDSVDKYSHLPQLGEVNSPRLMDAAGEGLLYDGVRCFLHSHTRLVDGNKVEDIVNLV